MSDRKKFSNRLINEKSPYLLQHASNPVDWYPWCDDAFNKATRENKPIFLSIGYSTCHWCHVMERESFEDEETASQMNKYLVSIKVDREERPDIDNIYMMVCQLMTGSGGWPLSIIMTPDKKPFFAGTYFPKESGYGRIGFKELINNINNVWLNKRAEIEDSAGQITNHLQKIYSTDSSVKLSSDIIDDAYKYFAKRYDQVCGGFGNAPKFPSPHNLMFLLRYWKRTKEEKPLTMVIKTLLEMRRGGIYDHIGFGFHRYSTDKQWLVPHFEKMLYDQALLAMAYTEAFQATGDDEFKKTVKEIFAYIFRDMTSSDGAFYSAEDADSEGEEGKFYVWTKKEIIEAVDETDSELAIKIFNVESLGNFHSDFASEQTEINILHLSKSTEELSRSIGLDKQILKDKIESIKQKLFEHRKKRIHPQKDDKVLTDWNSLMITALAKAGRAFDNDDYISAAEKCVLFIEKKLTGEDGKLIHRFRNGDASLTANLDDYAFFIWGLIELYESTFKSSYLMKAIDLIQFTLKHFWDEFNSGFFFTPDYGEELIVRTKEIYDGAIPSGNSAMFLNLIQIARITADNQYENFARKLIDCFSDNISKAPSGLALFLSAFDFLIGTSYEVIIVGSKNDPATQKFISIINEKFVPNKVLILHDTLNPECNLPFNYLQSYSQINSKVTVFVCKNYQCSLPTTDINEALNLLDVTP